MRVVSLRLVGRWPELGGRRGTAALSRWRKRDRSRARARGALAAGVLQAARRAHYRALSRAGVGAGAHARRDGRALASVPPGVRWARTGGGGDHGLRDARS